MAQPAESREQRQLPAVTFEPMSLRGHQALQQQVFICQHEPFGYSWWPESLQVVPELPWHLLLLPINEPEALHRFLHPDLNPIIRTTISTGDEIGASLMRALQKQCRQHGVSFSGIVRRHDV